MSDWVDTHDIGMDGVPDDFDSVADFGDGSDAGDGLDGGLGEGLGDADAWIVDLDLGGLADLADVAVVAGVDDLGEGDTSPGGDDPSAPSAPRFASLLAHDLTNVPDGSDPFNALAGHRLDDDELRNEIRHLRVRSPFASPEAEPAER